MKVLALDAATEACSAALWLDGRVIERHEVIGRGHAERLLPMVDELLTEAGLALDVLDGIGFGRGPGGFTGLRIAASITQGLALGAGLPVAPVSTLAALAAGAAPDGADAKVLACLDARMGEVYWAAYAVRQGLPEALTPEAVSAAAAVSLPDDRPGWRAAGHGLSAYPEIAARLSKQLGSQDAMLLPRAAAIARIAAAELAAGRGIAARDAVPTYLRDDVVHHRPVP